MKELTIEEIRKCSVGVLDYIDQICKENNLQYYLCGGTLLGAVRHQGFIPWDDDIDIMMPRLDYERLLKVWPTKSYYEILNHKINNNFPCAYSKVFDRRTIKFQKIRDLCQMGGVDVDVFPIDNIPNDDDETERFFKEIKEIDVKLYGHSYPFCFGESLERTIKDNIWTLITRISDFFCHNSVNKYTKLFDELAQKYNQDETLYCGITSISHYGSKEKNLKTNYTTSIEVLFEGKSYPAPCGYDIYLEKLYGNNYMQLPPKENRVRPHGYKVYWR